MELARTIVNALEEKKGEDIILIDIQEVAFFADYFVLCSGTSDRMLNSLADATVEQVKKQYTINGRIEGRPDEGWVVVDFGDVVVHLFAPEQRDYYNLEELWETGKILLRLQ
ncbi:MAG: ribosome silencing factor [Anaerolineaceae bacterium]|nr:ribosome silencing factor [Anaerolineaceae bacterium]